MGKALLITGASTGIGAACARHFAARGYRVYAGVRRAEDGERLREGASGEIVPVLLDVTEARTVEAVRTLLAEQEGAAGLAGLINNAGIAVAAPLECVPAEDFRRQYEVNVFGALAVTQACLPLLRQARGRILMMSSVSGRTTLPFLGPYSSSKFALEAMADALRMELARWGVHVSVIEPGPIATPIWEKSYRAAVRMRDSVPDACHALYGDMLVKFEQAMENAARSAIPADAVVAAVDHALTSPKPRTRYLVGRNARLGAWLSRFYPDRLRDFLILRGLGL